MTILETMTKTTCPYCGVGCGVLINHADDGSVTVKGDPEHPANYGRLCSKGSALGDTLSYDGRLLEPSVNGQSVSWDNALNTVSDKLTDIIKQYGSQAVAFYVSGQLLTEDYYVANKLMKGFIGSANIDTNSRLCMSSAVAGYKRAFGSDTVPGNYQDLEQAELIVLVGSNLAWCHPILYQRISQAKEKGKLKVIVIDPRKTASCDIADLHLAIKPGSDAMLFNGLLLYLDKHDKFDADFIAHHTEGMNEALATAKSAAVDEASLADHCGISQTDLISFFASFANTEKTVTIYSQGINQSSSGTDKSNSIINCYLATGRIGQPAMGPFSVTGQPNAMGGREVGGLSNQLAAHMELTNPEHHDLVSRFWHSEQLANHSGSKAVDMFDDIASGKIKAIWIMATNPVVSMPEADKVKAAIEQCELVIVSDCEANTDTTACADVLLPALAWGEKSGTVTNSERRISRQRTFLEVPEGPKADWWILTQVAHRMGFAEEFPYQSSADIFREHAALSGFENNGSRDFDISGLSQLTDEHYDALLPIQWPVNAIAPDGSERMFENKHFFTPSGRANLVPVSPRQPQSKVSAEYPLVLNTGRVRDQWHTMTRTARSSKLNSHIAEPMIEVHPIDAIAFGLKNGMLAQVSSPLASIIVRVVISEGQQEGNVFIPIHWNQQYASNARVDTLIAANVDPISGQPEFKYTPVSIKPYKAAWYGFILSRMPLSVEKPAYWLKIKGQHFWRYELAGNSALAEPIIWAHQQLGEDVGGDWLEYEDKALSRYRVANVVDDQLQKVLFINEQYDLPSRAWLSQLFSQPAINREERMSLLAGRPGSGLPDVGSLVCACFGVGENTIIDTIKNQQLNSVGQIGECLKAGTNCGSCIPELKTLLANNR